MVAEITRHHFTVTEYYRMGETGIFHEDSRVELIDGEIVDMSPIGTIHAWCVNTLGMFFVRGVDDTILVSVQNPVRLGDYSEPQPDVTLSRLRDGSKAKDHPGPDNILLIIEVCDTTLTFDRTIKLPLYARAGIPEVWLVDLEREIVHCHSEPAGGAYQKNSQSSGEEILRPILIPSLQLAAAAVFA